MRAFEYLLSFLLLIIGLVPIKLLSQLVKSQSLWLISLTAYLVLVLIFLILGQNILLAIIRARKEKPYSSLEEICNNFSSRLELKRVDIYSSLLYDDNIYVFSSFFSRPKIIIGENLKKYLSKREIEALILYSLVLIKEESLSLRTFNSFLYGIYVLPKTISNSFLKRDNLFNLLIEFFWRPIVVSFRVLFEKKYKVSDYKHPILLKHLPDLKAAIKKLEDHYAPEVSSIYDSSISLNRVVDQYSFEIMDFIFERKSNKNA